jgi:hypothetical protein
MFKLRFLPNFLFRQIVEITTVRFSNAHYFKKQKYLTKNDFYVAQFLKGKPDQAFLNILA